MKVAEKIRQSDVWPSIETSLGFRRGRVWFYRLWEDRSIVELLGVLPSQEMWLGWPGKKATLSSAPAYPQEDTKNVLEKMSPTSQVLTRTNGALPTYALVNWRLHQLATQPVCWAANYLSCAPQCWTNILVHRFWHRSRGLVNKFKRMDWLSKVLVCQMENIDPGRNNELWYTSCSAFRVVPPFLPSGSQQ